MEYALCEKIRMLIPYAPMEGNYRVRLDANESYLTPDDALRRELLDAAFAVPLNRYPDPYAEELCAAFGKRYGISPELVTAGNGSDELIGLICGSLLQKSDCVLTLSPDFSMYRFYSELFENPVCVLEKNADLTVSAAEILTCAQKHAASAIFFSNPCNPTGQGMSREEVRKLVRATHALVVLDEAYMDFWDQSLLTEVAEFENLIILRTCSKAVGLAAARVGFAVANPTLTRALRAAKSPYNVNALSQALATRLLSKETYLDDCQNALIQGTDHLAAGLQALAAKFPLLERVYLTCTNFVFVKSAKAAEIHQELLVRSIAVRCFSGLLRISTGSPAENEELLAALSDILLEGGKR